MSQLLTIEPDVQEILSGPAAQRIYLCEQAFFPFAIYHFPEFFTFRPAPYHAGMVEDLEQLARFEIDEVLWKMYRESAKTTYAKLFVTWLIVYKKRRNINWDSYDGENAEAALYDVAHWLQTRKTLIQDYGQLYFANNRTFFNKDGRQRESTIKRINNFITENSIRVEAHTTQESIRGRLTGENRPDFLVFDDIENNKTKESPVITKKIIDHVDEARSGIGTAGGVLTLGNYIIEDGVIAYLEERAKNNPRASVRDVAVEDEKENITWPDKFVRTDAEAAKLNVTIIDPYQRKVSLEAKERFLGKRVYAIEMKNNPGKSEDLIFDRERIDHDLARVKKPVEAIGGLRIYFRFENAHRYACGGDVAEGKGNDSCADVVMDFSTNRIRICACYDNEADNPVSFAHAMKRHGNLFGQCLVAPEVNAMGYATVAELRRPEVYREQMIYVRELKDHTTGQVTNEYGWRTTSSNKGDLVYQYADAYNAGHLEIYDKKLLNEMKIYRKQHVPIIKSKEGLTRHFDLLMSAMITYAMRDHAKLPMSPASTYKQKPWQG